MNFRTAYPTFTPANNLSITENAKQNTERSPINCQNTSQDRPTPKSILKSPIKEEDQQPMDIQIIRSNMNTVSLSDPSFLMQINSPQMNYIGSGPIPFQAVDESNNYLAASQGSGAYPVFEDNQSRPIMKMNRIKSKTPVFAQTAASTIP